MIFFGGFNNKHHYFCIAINNDKFYETLKENDFNEKTQRSEYK